MVYFALMWRQGDDWGWLRSLDGNEECTTQIPFERLRYRTKEGAMVALWKFRRDNPVQPKETLHLVRVHVIRRAKAGR
jgi:hypothetical protein